MTSLPDRALHTALGERLRTLRLRTGMSLRDAATSSGLSASFISLLERGRSEIGVSRLIRLADAYGVPVNDLLAERRPEAVEFTASSDGLCVAPGEDGFELTYLSSPSWPLQPFRICLQPGVEQVSQSHYSEESAYCVSGHLAIIVRGEMFQMSPGDTLLIPAHYEHSYRNASDAPATIVCSIRRLDVIETAELE